MSGPLIYNSFVVTCCVLFVGIWRISCHSRGKELLHLCCLSLMRHFGFMQVCFVEEKLDFWYVMKDIGKLIKPWMQWQFSRGFNAQPKIVKLRYAALVELWTAFFIFLTSTNIVTVANKWINRPDIELSTTRSSIPFVSWTSGHSMKRSDPNFSLSTGS